MFFPRSPAIKMLKSSSSSICLRTSLICLFISDTLEGDSPPDDVDDEDDEDSLGGDTARVLVPRAFPRPSLPANPPRYPRGVPRIIDVDDVPARPPRIVVVDVVVVVVVVLTDVDASAERANDAIVYPLPRSSTPRALASSSFSDVVVLCRRPSSFARSRTPGPRADDVDRSVGRSVGQILVVVVVRAVRTVVLILHNGPFILTPTPTPPFPHGRESVRPYVVDARTTRRVSRVRRSLRFFARDVTLI